MAQISATTVRRWFGGHSTRALVTRRGVSWELDLAEGIDFSIWLLGSFEPTTVRYYERVLVPGNTVIDIGANIGAHTLFMANRVGPEGRVVAIEPTDVAFVKLERNIALNPRISAAISPCQIVLGRQDGDVTAQGPLYASWPLRGGDDTHPIHGGRRLATKGAVFRTLDQTVARLGLTRVDFIKLDVDGAECEVLRGAQETLSRWRPLILMEIAPYLLRERGATLGEMLGLLRGTNYRLYDIVWRRPLPMDAGVLAARIAAGASINAIAQPAAGP